MRKNFFKKLSFVLALAMIISVIAPAAGAFAASAPKLNAKTKYLHLDKEGVNDFNFNIRSKQKGWKYLWSSANEDVASVEKNGVVTATGVGTTKVSVVISEDGEEVDELTATVTVRDNVAELTSLYIQGTTPPAVDKLSVGVEYDFGRKFKTVSGSTTKTGSVTRWSVDKTTATIGKSGKFTATVAGTYVITARSFQSASKYAAWLLDNAANVAYVLATKTIEVKVNASIESVVQADIDTLKVAFTSPMVDVDKNISVYALIGTTKVKQTVKEVKMDDAKKVAEVTLYVPFTSGATYVVDYTNMTSGQFVAATTKAEDVTAMALVTTKAEANKATDLAVKLFNKDGVDITTADLLLRVTYASSSEKSYLNGKSLTIFAINDVTTITATFHTYKYDATGVETGNIVATGVVVGTDKDATVVGGTTAWTIVTGSPVFTDVKHVIAAEDRGYKFFVQIKTTTGSTETKVSSENNTKFTFTSSDETVLFINNADDMIYPLKQGTATIVVKYDDKVVDAVTVVVGAKRVAAALTLDAYTVALSNSVAVNDSKVVTLTLKDQFGAEIALKDTKIEKLSGSPNDESKVTDDIASLVANKVTFNGVVAGVAAEVGTYTYKITTNGLAQLVTVVVTKPATITADYYKLSLSATSVDLKVETGETAKVVTVDLFGYATNGVKTTNEAVSGGAFVVKVTNPDGGVTILTANGEYALTSVTASAISGQAIVKAKTGTYKVSVFEGAVAKDITYFTVTDTQAVPTFSTVTLASDVSGVLASVKKCFKFTLGDKVITEEVVDVDFVGAADGTTVFIKSVKYQEQVGTGLYLEHTITVNTNITKK